MARRKSVASRSLAALQAALTPAPAPGPAFNAICTELHAAVQSLVDRGDWRALFELRAWARAHPLFQPNTYLRGFLRRWEEVLLSGAPLVDAAALVRDDVATAVCDPWERLAARASWAELRPLLRDDAAAWSVAEARVLRGEPLRGRSPISGMPRQLFRWEPRPELPHFSVTGSSWSSRGFSGALAPTALPEPLEAQACELAWGQLLAVWGGPKQVVKIAGTGLQALAGVLGPREARVGPCTWKQALSCLMHAHGSDPPYGEGRGMVEARRAVWRLLAALAGARWPVSGGALQAAMKGWRWSRYDPQEPYADPEMWSVFLVLEDPRRGLAWAVYAWVTD